MAVESLERRAMLAISAVFSPPGSPGVLFIDYNVGTTTSNQNAVIEIDEVGPSPQTVRVNLFRSSNPDADVFTGVTEIVVNVPNFDTLGVNNNSLTIKGLESPEDRIIMAGSGRTVAGRWYDQLPEPDQNQILFEITGIDNLILTAGGTINVSGAFTNDTDDASITVIGTSLETDENRTPYPNQHTATVVLGENTPEQSPEFPAARLFSNYINVVGGAIEINSDIEAEGEVSLMVSDLSANPTNLVLPHDITVSSRPGSTVPGRLDLFSPRSVLQLATSVIEASVVNVVAEDTFGPFNGSVIDLSTAKNDFDVISLQSGTGLAASTGQVAVRDCDDLVVVGHGLISTTGFMSLHATGLLTIDTPIDAGGLKAYSDTAIKTTDRAVFTIGNGGIDLAARAVANPTATGDITLEGRIEVGANRTPVVVIDNAIRADGQVAIMGGLFSPQAGRTIVSGSDGILVASPLQVGGTFLDAAGTTVTVSDGDLSLVSANGPISILDAPGNTATDTIGVTNALTIDAFGDVYIDGDVFVGTRLGNALDPTLTAGIPSITLRSQAAIEIDEAGSLRTSALRTDPSLTTNPRVGLIEILDATFLEHKGSIDADGELRVSVEGDAYLFGSAAARSDIAVLTTLGSVDIQGAMQSRGAAYVDPGAKVPVVRSADVTVLAPNGFISTSSQGTIAAGTVTVNLTPPTFGTVRLEAQQNVTLAAAVDTPGPIDVTSLLGSIDVLAVVRNANNNAISLSAGNGLYETADDALVWIETADLQLLNTGAAGGLSDIDLMSPANAIGTFTAENRSPGGDVKITVAGPLATGGITTTAGVTEDDPDTEVDEAAFDPGLTFLRSTGGMTQTGPILTDDLDLGNANGSAITLADAGNRIDRFAATNLGGITFSAAGSYRVGLLAAGTPSGEVVEVVGSEVSLAATDRIQVVAGIQAGTLKLTSAVVEFVTTSEGDNPAGPFNGTFRDMINLSNANSDMVSPHVMVFGEDPGYPGSVTGYSVAEITLAESLPALTRAATIDGTTADGGRLGILGTSGIATGVWFSDGSTGSRLTGAALYGFSSGSALVIDSAEHVIDDTWFGLRADETGSPANRIGVNISGDRAFNNLIGSDFVFDPDSANRFAGHTDAAIVVQRGASNNLVAGNLVGGDGLTANRSGIRIDGGSGNRIGTPDQVTPDLRPTESNRIVGNSHYGIEIRNVRGSTTRVENNVVAGNATKVGSGTHGIGVLNSAFVQIGGLSELSCNQVFGSLGGSGIHLSGSNNIRIQGNVIGADGYHLSANGHTNDYDANRPDLGNHMHGIHVFGRSRDVEIDGNRIVDNERSGVAIASGSSGVLLTNNEIGVWVHPVTGNVHAAGNDADGVTITAANGNTIGAGNLIGFNRGSGIMVENSVAAGLATGNRLAGAELFGNLGHGIHVSGSSRQTVGGYSGEGNVIKENGLDGIRVENDPRIRASAAPHGNVVAGNFVGTNDNQEIDRNWGNRNGIAVMNGVENVLAGNVVMNNRASGIEIGGGDGNTVGGQVGSAGNFVGYNFGDGVYIHDQASTQLQVGVIGTTITNQGGGYAASRTSVIFTAPAASGGVPARGVAIVSASGRVTGIRLTSSGSGYAVGEPVSVTIFDPQASVIATASVMLGEAARRPDGVAAVSEVSRRHVVSGNEIEANNGAGIYVKGERTTEIQLGQDLNGRAGRGLGNKISFHDVGILIDAAGRTSLQGNELGDNGMPIDLINGANQDGFGPVEVIRLTSTAWGRGQTRVTGTIINANNGDGKIHEFWVDVYATPHYDLDEDVNGDTFGHEMRQFLGRTLVTTDANGRAAISLVVSETVGLGDSISLTLTSNRHEDGSTVGVWHAKQRHSLDLTSTPTTGSPTVTPTAPGGSSGGASTPGRAPVPPRG